MSLSIQRDDPFHKIVEGMARMSEYLGPPEGQEGDDYVPLLNARTDATEECQ